MTVHPAPGSPPPDADLLDEQQIGLLLEVLSADDWNASVAAFADNGRKTLDTLISQARAGEAHSRTAHTLKGSALNLGAAALGQLAKELEHAAAAAVLAREADLCDLFDRSVTLLRTRTPQAP